jgi:hypothetical protein
MSESKPDPREALREALNEWATRTEPWTGPAGTAEDGYNWAIEEVVAMLNDKALAQAAPPPERVRPGGYLTPPFSAAQAAPPSGLDEEHCCGDLSHMSPEYIAALSPTPAMEGER